MPKKEGIKKGLLALVAVLALGLGILGFNNLNPTTADALSGAGASGASGGGGGGGDPTGGWQWTWGPNLNSLYNAPGIGAHGGAEAYVKAGANGTNLWNNYCLSPDLVRVYWIIGKNDPWAKSFNSGGIAQPWNNPAGGDAIDQFSSQYAGKGVYVICVKNDIERKSFIEYDSRTQSGSTTITGNYSWTSQVTPEVVDSSGKDLIGADNLNAQSTTVKSNFASVYDSIASSGTGDYNAKVNQINQAKANDANADHAVVGLNSGNQAGLAEGGVLSVSEFTRNGTITLSQSWSETRSRTVTCDYPSGTQNPNRGNTANPPNCVEGAWSGYVEDAGSRNHTVTKNLGTQANTGFWQILSVHCNPDELSAALSAYGRAGVDYNIVSQTQTDSGVTTVVYTANQAQRPTGSGAKLFGVNQSPVTNSALLRTGQLGFYDKECSLQCTTTPPSGTPGNGAQNNVSNDGNLQDKEEFGGAKSGTTISNYFEMFRDNESRRIAVNVAYPNTAGTPFTYNGAAAISTTVTLWHDPGVDLKTPLTIAEGQAGYPSTGSTPDTSAPGGQLTILAANGTGTGASSTRTNLFTGTQAPTEQKNFSKVDASHPVDTYSGPYATQLAGQFSRFDVSSTWASLADRPVVLNVKWEYQPTTATRVPGAAGFSKANVQNVGGWVSINQPIDVRCYAVYGTSNSSVTDYVAKEQTGTGTPNTIDTNVIDSDALNSGADSSAFRTNTNLVIKFIRGVAE